MNYIMSVLCNIVTQFPSNMRPMAVYVHKLMRFVIERNDFEVAAIENDDNARPGSVVGEIAGYFGGAACAHNAN